VEPSRAGSLPGLGGAYGGMAGRHGRVRASIPRRLSQSPVPPKPKTPHALFSPDCASTSRRRRHGTTLSGECRRIAFFGQEAGDRLSIAPQRLVVQHESNTVALRFPSTSTSCVRRFRRADTSLRASQRTIRNWSESRCANRRPSRHEEPISAPSRHSSLAHKSCRHRSTTAASDRRRRSRGQRSGWRRTETAVFEQRRDVRSGGEGQELGAEETTVTRVSESGLQASDGAVRLARPTTITRRPGVGVNPCCTTLKRTLPARSPVCACIVKLA
jgi:hypothetical protein